jgi:broad specificity phosphatase PhoE
MKHLYFMRHGENEANVQQLYVSRGYSPLTERGRMQAKMAGKQAVAAGPFFDAMLVSPLGRAQQTADIISRYVHVPVRETYEAIIERDLSALEGEPYDLNGRISTYAQLDTIAGVETTAALQVRAANVLAVLRMRPESSILLVSHGAFGQALQRAVAGRPWEDQYLQGSGDAMPHAEILKLI